MTTPAQPIRPRAPRRKALSACLCAALAWAAPAWAPSATAQPAEAPPLTVDAAHPQPGLWEQTTLFSRDGATWRPGPTRRACITDALAQDWQNQTRQQLALVGCTLQQVDLVAGRVQGQVACAARQSLRVDVGGQYTPDSYALDLVAHVAVAGLPPMRARWVGRRLSAC